ncbi:MAG: RIP metalloprotease RseP [Patescibacteria group bacterium]|nr:RIP metalloprotease RseP [Patescibacteria group bacterium]
MILTTIVLFLLILGVIVFVHELGHFMIAKLYNVKVEEFALGFPPRIFSFKKGETEYSLNAVPLGGYCKIVGENGEDKDDPRSFGSKSVGKRFLILSAGVIMNFVLAFVIFSAIFMAGFPQDITNEKLSIIKSENDRSFSETGNVMQIEGAKSVKDVKVQISEIVKDTPADKAGLEIGDTIVKAGEKEIRSVEDLQKYTEENLGKLIVLSIIRGKEDITKEITPRAEHPDDEGAMGISLVKTAVVSYSPLEAIRKGYEYTVHLTVFIIMAFASILWGLITTGKTAAEVSGPIGIAIMTKQAASMGFMTILNFTALISVNLAIINALPFPALDGGRLLFLVVEKIKGSPLNQKWEAKANNVGFALLMLLMVVITFKDITKFDLLGKVMNMLG